MKNKKLKREKGITLIALAITIIILLILAGITITAITGENGILNSSIEAKVKTEIENEKEIINRATAEAIAEDTRGNIKEENLQKELDNETEKGKTEVTDIGDEFEVVFIESNRYYSVDKDGNISEANELKKDEHPADITIGENGEKLDGSEEKPYEISSIEDLVIFSNLSRGKGNYIENGEIKDAPQKSFSGDNVILTKDLNFNSRTSYSDLSMTWSYDESEKAYIIDKNSTKNLRELLIDRNGVGFIAIGNYFNPRISFMGNFDGQNHEIKNLYQNNEYGGLFEAIYNATIKNLELTDIDIVSNQNAAGITTGCAGISNLYNICITGKIKGGNVGGIIGTGGHTIKAINCCNVADIEASEGVGGIIEYIDTNTTVKIINCYNTGKLYSSSASGTYGSVSGILGAAYNKTTSVDFKNICSMGIIEKPKGTGQNIWLSWDGSTANLENCYYLDSIINNKVTVNENTIPFSKSDKTIIEKLNTFVNQHKDEYDVKLYDWKLDEEGLPTFEITNQAD